jgi:tetrapyrrole methylase family protein/MazG family protein
MASGHHNERVTEPADLVVVGLGPAGLDRLPAATIGLLTDQETTVLVRTVDHPAAAELAALRPVEGCDDLYESAGSFDDVYTAIADRVVGMLGRGPLIYAVPGSPLVGERTVELLRRRLESVDLVFAESFLDLVFTAIGLDPIADGLQVVDGRNLPDPLPLHLPTVITQVDTPLVLADVGAVLGRVLDETTAVTVLDRLGDRDAFVAELPLAMLHEVDPGPRTSLFVPRQVVGWVGLVETNRILRRECPWDREQTHHTLLSHLVEEAYETVDALAALSVEAPGGEPDFGAYAVVEEELGDLMLQVVFHATLAREAGAFDVEDVAEGIRRKLVRRHPHVFGDVEVSGPSEVLANWEEIKHEEKGRASLMDDVPSALPGVARADKLQGRAASVGFDWQDAAPVYDKITEELGELRAAVDRDRQTSELGDVLFSVVNLARHLGVDAEAALARANDTFAARFRTMETLASEQGLDLRSLDLEGLDDMWETAKAVDHRR